MEDFVMNRLKSMFYGLLALVAMVSVSLVSKPTQANAAEKRLTSIPKVLRGYWYLGDSEYSSIIHFTGKHETFQTLSKKNKKQSFLILKKKKQSKVILSKKLLVNKTFTFSPNGHNNWFDRGISNTKRDGKSYGVNYYYLRGSKKSPELIMNIGVGIGGFPKISKVKNPMKGSDTYTKVSRKYLKSIGFYK